MLKCTFWPWLDETVEAAVAVGDKAGEVYDDMEPYVEDLQQRMSGYAGRAGRAASRARDDAEPYLRSAKSYVGDGMEELGDYAQDATEQYASGLKHRARRASRSASGYVNAGVEWAGKSVNAAGAHLYPDSEDVNCESKDDDEYNDVRLVGKSSSRHLKDDNDSDRRGNGKPSPTKKRGRPARAASMTRGPATKRASSRSRARSEVPTQRRSARLASISTTKAKAGHLGSSIELFHATEKAEAAGLIWALCSLGGAWSSQ